MIKYRSTLLLYPFALSLLTRHCLSLSGLQLRPIVAIFCPVYSLSCVDLVFYLILMAYLAISLFLRGACGSRSTLKGSVATSQVT